MVYSKKFQVLVAAIAVIFFWCGQLAVYANFFLWLPLAFGLFDRMDRGVRQWYYPGLILDVSVNPGQDYRTEYRNRYGIDYPSDREIHLGETNLSQYFEGGLVEGEDGARYRSLDGSIAYCVGETDWVTSGNFNFIGKTVNGTKIQVWLSPSGNEGASLLLREVEYKNTIGGKIQLFPVPESGFASDEAKNEYQKILAQMPFGKELVETIKIVPNGKGIEDCKGLQLRFISGQEMASRFCDPNLDVATGYFQGTRIADWRQEQGVDCVIETPCDQVSIEVWDRFGYIPMPEKVQNGYRFKAIPIETWKNSFSLKGKYIQVFYGKSQTTELSLDPPSPVDRCTKRQTGMVEIETGKQNIIKIVPLNQINATTTTTTEFQQAIIKVSGSVCGTMSIFFVPQRPVFSQNFNFGGYLWDEVSFRSGEAVEKMIVNFNGCTMSLTASCPQNGFVFDKSSGASYGQLDSAPLIPRAYRAGDKEFALESVQDCMDFANGVGRFSEIGGKANFIKYCGTIGIITTAKEGKISPAERLWQDFSSGNVGYVLAGPDGTFTNPATGKTIPVITSIKGVNWRDASGVVHGTMEWKNVSAWPQAYKVWVSTRESSITLGIIAKCGNFCGIIVPPPCETPLIVVVCVPGLSYPPERPKDIDTWGYLYLGGNVQSGHKVMVATATTYVGATEASKTDIIVYGSEASASAAASAAGGQGGSVGDIINIAEGGDAVATGGSTGPININNTNQNLIIPKSVDTSIR